MGKYVFAWNWGLPAAVIAAAHVTPFGRRMAR